MIGIILAAGRGRRMFSWLPKCLLRVGNESLLSRNLEILRSFGIPIAVVVGYGAGPVVKEVGTRAICIYNPRYSETGSLYSLWLARQALWTLKAKEAIVVYADMFTEPRVALSVLQRPESAVMIPGYDGRGTRLYLDDDGYVESQSIATDPDPEGVSFAGYARLPWDSLDRLDEIEGYETLSMTYALIGCPAITVEGISINVNTPQDLGRVRGAHT